MTSPTPPVRTQHRNLVTGADLTGPTVHRESRVNLEDYLEPITAARTQALHGAGVATGLRVTATAGAPGLAVGVGVAVDRRGRTVALQDAGVAVTAPDAVATSARNLATVPVTAAGVTIGTTDLTGTRLLTLAWAEAETGSGTQLRHAPWLQLLPAGDPNTAADAVVLARVELGPGGVVSGLTAGGRTTVTGRLSLRALSESPAPDLAVDHVDVAELRGRPDGGLDVALAGTGTPALAVLGGTGAVAVTGSLTVAGALQAATLASAGAVTVGGLLTVAGALRAATASVDSLTTGTLRAPDAISAFTVDPGTGADVARVRIGGEGAMARLTIGPGGNGRLHTRHIDGKHWLSDADDGLHLNWGTGQPVHVGGGAKADLNVNGNLSVTGAATVTGVTLPNNGTVSSSGRMHVSGEELLFLLNKQGVIVSAAWGGNGRLTVDGPLGSMGRHPVNGVPTGWAGGLHTWDVYAEGSIGCGPAGIGGGAVPAGMTNSGAIWGRSLTISGAKKFVIDHPLDPDRTLAHACIEGPEAAVYYRGEGRLVDGTAHVTLPVYFEALVREEGRTVQLTAVADADEPVALLATSPVVDGAFTVRAAGAVNPRQRFCWQVTGVRADVEPLEVEIPRRTAAVAEEAMARA